MTYDLIIIWLEFSFSYIHVQCYNKMYFMKMSFIMSQHAYKFTAIAYVTSNRIILTQDKHLKQIATNLVKRYLEHLLIGIRKISAVLIYMVTWYLTVQSRNDQNLNQLSPPILLINVE